MKITSKNILSDGTRIQIEDWSSDYSFHKKNDLLVAYPTAKESIGYFVERGESFRLELQFSNEKQAMDAYNKLLLGELELGHLKKYNHNKEANNAF